MDKLNLYIWEGKELNGSYGEDGCLIVLASTFDEARGYLKGYLTDAPRLAVTPLPRGISGNAYYEWLSKVSQPARQRNQTLLTAYTTSKVVVTSRGLEPPGNFEGRCYSWSWDWLLTATPTRVIPLRPGILVADYGYEG